MSARGREPSLAPDIKPQISPLATAALPLRPILGLGGGDRLPLHIRHGIGAAARQRDDMILGEAEAGAAGLAGGRAGNKAG